MSKDSTPRVYKYLHVNGKIIEKPERVVEMGGGPHVYFEGGMVIKYRHLTSQEDARKMLIEAEKICEERGITLDYYPDRDDNFFAN